MPINVAAVQYPTMDMNQAANQDRAIHILDDAAHSADIVLLPAYSFINAATESGMERFAVNARGPLFAIVAQLAVIRNCCVCYSVIERDGNRFFNTAVLVGADGSMLGKQRKIRLTETEKSLGLSAGDDIQVFSTPLGDIAILAIEDAADIECARHLHGKNPQIVLIASELRAISPDNIEATSSQWERFLRTIAERGKLCVMVANKIGGIQQSVFIGISMIVDSSGEILAKGSADQEEVVRTKLVVPLRGIMHPRHAA